jgi:hypothetical protein
MLAADKLQLQTTIKQQTTLLKEKEFKLHHENLMTVGTQAAVLAGLDVTMLIELSPSLGSEWEMLSSSLWFVPRTIKLFYYFTIVSAFCANILVVGQTTILSVMGASLALRGPDGSMMIATDGLYEERTFVFQVFAYGLVATLVSVILGVWLILPPESALVCMLCTIFTTLKLRNQYRRVKKRFLFNEEDTVDFQDLFDGTGNMNIPVSYGRREIKEASSGRGRGSKTTPNPKYLSTDDEEMAITNQSICLRSRTGIGTRKRNNAKYNRFEKNSDHDHDYDYSSNDDTAAVPLLTV